VFFSFYSKDRIFAETEAFLLKENLGYNAINWLLLVATNFPERFEQTLDLRPEISTSCDLWRRILVNPKITSSIFAIMEKYSMLPEDTEGSFLSYPWHTTSELNTPAQKVVLDHLGRLSLLYQPGSNRPWEEFEDFLKAISPNGFLRFVAKAKTHKQLFCALTSNHSALWGFLVPQKNIKFGRAWFPRKIYQK
jgi:hypothetical protein